MKTIKNIFSQLRTAEANLTRSENLYNREYYSRASDCTRDAKQQVIEVLTELEKLYAEYINEDDSKQLSNDCFITAQSGDGMTDPSGEDLMNDWAWKELN